MIIVDYVDFSDPIITKKQGSMSDLKLEAVHLHDQAMDNGYVSIPVGGVGDHGYEDLTHYGIARYGEEGTLLAWVRVKPQFEEDLGELIIKHRSVNPFKKST